MQFESREERRTRFAAADELTARQMAVTVMAGREYMNSWGTAVYGVPSLKNGRMSLKLLGGLPCAVAFRLFGGLQMDV